MNRYHYYVCHTNPVYQHWIYRVDSNGKIYRRDKNSYPPYYTESRYDDRVSEERLKDTVEKRTYKIISKQEANGLCRSWKEKE